MPYCNPGWYMYREPKRYPKETKKQRKAQHRENRYQNRMKKWIASEPPKWRFISYIRWMHNEPVREKGRDGR